MSMKGKLGMYAALAALLADPGHAPAPRIKVQHYDNTESLISEYLLIKAKKSKLSRRQRDSIVWRVEYLIEKGNIILPTPNHEKQ